MGKGMEYPWKCKERGMGVKGETNEQNGGLWKDQERWHLWRRKDIN